MQNSVLCLFVTVALLTVIFSTCSTKDPKFNQYYAEGERLYEMHCSNCHQRSGKGLMLVYPPLDSSDYLDRDLEEIICLMKYGAKGPMMVNGKLFNQPMPGIRSLTPLEMAEISTYLYNTWGREKGLIDVQQVEVMVGKCVIP